ncbi:MAG TPA: nuclear transport factor 2 family protein [Steroidobacteraceae bacterium]|nr:nuclear transport factor 2 family protein [Steroidobacteraceae bacterium]
MEASGKRSNSQLVRDFFTALSAGDLKDELFTDDVSIWTNTAGKADKARFQAGVKVLQSLFEAGYRYTVDSLTAEEDRVAAEAQARGKLKSGEDFHNTYMFMFRIRNGRIASIAEHGNSILVREKLVPLLQAAMRR